MIAPDRAVLDPFMAPATDVDLRVRAWLRSHVGHPDEPAPPTVHDR